MDDLLQRYLELEEERKVPRRRRGNAFFSEKDNPQKALLQKRKDRGRTSRSQSEKFAP